MENHHFSNGNKHLKPINVLFSIAILVSMIGQYGYVMSLQSGYIMCLHVLTIWRSQHSNDGKLRNHPFLIDCVLDMEVPSRDL